MYARMLGGLEHAFLVRRLLYGTNVGTDTVFFFGVVGFRLLKSGGGIYENLKKKPP